MIYNTDTIDVIDFFERNMMDKVVNFCTMMPNCESISTSFNLLVIDVKEGNFLGHEWITRILVNDDFSFYCDSFEILDDLPNILNLIIDGEPVVEICLDEEDKWII